MTDEMISLLMLLFEIEDIVTSKKNHWSEMSNILSSYSCTRQPYEKTLREGRDSQLSVCLPSLEINKQHTYTLDIPISAPLCIKWTFSCRSFPASCTSRLLTIYIYTYTYSILSYATIVLAVLHISKHPKEGSWGWRDVTRKRSWGWGHHSVAPCYNYLDVNKMFIKTGIYA